MQQRETGKTQNILEGMEDDQALINSVERQPQHPLASCFKACYSWQLRSSAYVKILSGAHSIFSEM